MDTVHYDIVAPVFVVPSALVLVCTMVAGKVEYHPVCNTVDVGAGVVAAVEVVEAHRVFVVPCSVASSCDVAAILALVQLLLLLHVASAAVPEFPQRVQRYLQPPWPQ